MKNYRVEFRKDNTVPILINAHKMRYEDGNVLFIDEGPPSRLVAIINTDTILMVTEQPQK